MPDVIVSQKVDDFMRTATAAQMRAVLEAIQLNGALGTPTSGVATNLTGLPVSTGLTGVGTGVAAALAANVGSGGAFVTFNGNAGTPSALVGTNITGTAAGLTAGTASAVAVGGITGLGTGVAAALATANGSAGGYATINGVAALTNKTYNGLTVTTTTGTLTLAAAKVLTVSNTLTFTGTDGSSVAFGTGGTVLYSGGAGFVSSIAGTANQITASAATGAVTLSIPATFIAPGSIATTTTLLVGNGTAGTALSALTVYDTGTSLPRGISNVQVSASADSANFSAYKARGTIGSEAAVTNSDILGNFRAWGYSGAGGYVSTGSLMFRVPATGTVATTRVPGEAVISVGTDAAPSVLTETAKFSSMTGITLTALGPNQNITLTPGGTGGLSVTGAGSATLGLLRLPTGGTAATGIAWHTDTILYRVGAGTVALDGVGGTHSEFIGRENGTTRWGIQSDSGATILTSDGGALTLRTNAASNVILAYNATSVFQLTSATNAQVIGTKTLSFGATANATIGVSADTTAGNFKFTTTTTGNFTWANAGTLATLSNAGTFSATASVAAGGLGLWDGSVMYRTNVTTSTMQMAGSAGSAGAFTAYGSTHASKPGYAEVSTAGAISLTIFGGATPIVGFGGITSSFPALKRSSTELQVKLADDSAYAPLAIGNTVSSAVAVASTHKVTMNIGGATYYLLATNV